MVRLWLHQDNTDLIIVGWLLERAYRRYRPGPRADYAFPDTDFAVKP